MNAYYEKLGSSKIGQTEAKTTSLLGNLDLSRDKVRIAAGGTGAATFAAAGLTTLTGSETLTNKTLTNPTVTNYETIHR